MAEKAEHAPLLLRIVTPTGCALEQTCDSVRLSTPDGSIGIRKGHIKSLILLGSGPISAYLNDELIASKEAGSGFATVDNNLITVIADSVT